MSTRQMSEPVSSAAGSLLLYKLGAFGLASALAAIVVMAMNPPKTRRELLVSLICTVTASVSGGSFVLHHFGLINMMADPFGTIAAFGIVFACGLPGWVIVRWWFAFADDNKDENLLDVINKVRGK